MKPVKTLPWTIASLLGLSQCYVGPPPEMASMGYGAWGMSELGTMAAPPPGEPYAAGVSYGGEDRSVRTYGGAPAGAPPVAATGTAATGSRHYLGGLEAGRREREDGDPYNPAVHIARYRLTAADAASFESGYAAGYGGR